jgi:hypothetical protein
LKQRSTRAEEEVERLAYERARAVARARRTLTLPEDATARPGKILADGLARLSGYHPDAVNRDAVRQEAYHRVAQFFGGHGEVERARRIESYFTRSYRIGEEDAIQDIPPLVTLRRVISLLLVVLHVLENALPPAFKSSAVGNLLSKLLLRPLSFVAGGLYGFVMVLAQGSRAAAAAHAVAWSIIIVGLGSVYLGITTAKTAVLSAVALATLFEGLIALCSRRDLRAVKRVQWWHLGALAILPLFLAVRGSTGTWQNAVRTVLEPVRTLLEQRHPFYSWTGGSPAMVFFLFMILMAAAGLMGSILLRLGRHTHTRQGGIVAWELAGNAEQSLLIKQEWNATARAYVALSLGLDFVFLVLYSTAIGFGCVWTARMLAAANAPFWAGVGILLAWGQWCAAILDAVENVLLLQMLFGWVTERKARLVRGCAAFKFVLVLLGLLYIIFGFSF